MGLRSLAKRVVGKVVGRDSGAGSGGAQGRPSASLDSPAVVTPKKGEVVADAESMANIECGVQELIERLGAGERVTCIDVRTPAERVSGVLEGARLIPLDELEARWQEVATADEIVCYCASGMRSVTAARLLRSKGLINATSMEGGIAAWRQFDGPVVPVP